MQQRQVFLGLSAFVELLTEAVVGQAEPRGRKQIVAVGVVRERSRLPHQRVDHMSVMHRVLVPTDESWQRVGEFVRVPDFHAVGEESGFDPFTDQSAMHRVGAAVNVDQASRIDSARHLEATRQTHIGHPCPPGRDGQRGSLFEQLPQLADLPIGDDHRRPPGVGGCVRPRLSDGNSNCRWKGVLIAALHLGPWAGKKRDCRLLVGIPEGQARDGRFSIQREEGSTVLLRQRRF